MAENREHRVECWCTFIEFVDQDHDGWLRILTGDESWWCKFDQETKRQNLEWRGTKNVRLQNRVSRKILVIFFRCCRNYPPRVCSLKDHSERSLLFGSDETSLRTHAPCQKWAVPKSQLLLLHETRPSLRVRCEGISSFQTVLCDPAPPYSPYLAPAEFFSSRRWNWP